MHSILKTMELYSKMFSFQLQHFLWNDTDFLWCIQHDFGKDFMRFFGKQLIKTPSYWIDKIVPLEKTYLKGTTTKGCWTFSIGIQFVWNTSSLFCRNIGVLKKKYYIVLWCGICQCKRHSHLGGCLRTIALMHWILFFEVNFAY